VNVSGFISAAGQSFSSMVRPVSVSFEVEGQRTNKLFKPARAFGFGRGGSK
jgi:hypothetical protein